MTAQSFLGRLTESYSLLVTDPSKREEGPTVVRAFVVRRKLAALTIIGQVLSLLLPRRSAPLPRRRLPSSRTMLGAPPPSLPKLRLLIDGCEYRSRPRARIGLGAVALAAAQEAWDAADKTLERNRIRKERQRAQSPRAASRRARPIDYDDDAAPRVQQQRRDESSELWQHSGQQRAARSRELLLTPRQLSLAHLLGSALPAAAELHAGLHSDDAAAVRCSHSLLQAGATTQHVTSSTSCPCDHATATVYTAAACHATPTVYTADVCDDAAAVRGSHS